MNYIIKEDEFLYVFEKNEKTYGLYGEIEYLEKQRCLIYKNSDYYKNMI